MELISERSEQFRVQHRCCKILELLEEASIFFLNFLCSNTVLFTGRRPQSCFFLLWTLRGHSQNSYFREHIRI